jgi:outer membrane protein insertion porin family/translocation and assembly module TamA
VGVRVFTPVGPFQMNVGYNPYPRPAARSSSTRHRTQGFAPLYCVSPGNQIPAVRAPTAGTSRSREAAAPPRTRLRRRTPSSVG